MKLKVKLFGKNAFVEGDAYGKKAMASDYYKLSITCKNCKAITNVWIKKTVKVNDIITAIRCSNCQCRLEKQENK